MLSKQVAAAITYPTISAEPHQPKRFNFHKREFSKKSIVKQSFQTEWFLKLPWFRYREHDDTVFCHTYVKTFKKLKMSMLSLLSILKMSLISIYNILTCWNMVVEAEY